MQAPNEITASQLARLIFCTQRHAHTGTPGPVQRLAGRPAILTCKTGRKLSQRSASALVGLSRQYSKDQPPPETGLSG